mmetsp:Transcript_3125/g.4914  ORF Transcript_3125/g.4914 Transcript_3125/m.4914 type:complete len:202 (-) Transcript_3125:1462-2067(-)
MSKMQDTPLTCNDTLVTVASILQSEHDARAKFVMALEEHGQRSFHCGKFGKFCSHRGWHVGTLRKMVLGKVFDFLVNGLHPLRIELARQLVVVMRRRAVDVVAAAAAVHTLNPHTTTTVTTIIIIRSRTTTKHFQIASNQAIRIAEPVGIIRNPQQHTYTRRRAVGVRTLTTLHKQDILSGDCRIHRNVAGYTDVVIIIIL